MAANVSTQAGTNALVSQAEQQGQALQSSENAQDTSAENAYNTDQSQASSAYSNLLNYTKNLPNFGSLYGQYETAQEQQAGYNPAQMQNYVNAANTTAEAYANAPQAAQQMSNYSGATAGQETQNLSNMSGNLATSSAGANTALQNYTALYNAANTAANNQTTQALGGYTLGETGYNDVYTQANQQMANATSQLNNIQQVAETQGYYTAQQINELQGAYSGLVNAQAAAESASASMISAQSQASLNQQKAVQNFLSSNPTTTAQNMANALGIPLSEAGAYLTSMTPTSGNGLTVTTTPSNSLGSVVNPQSGSVNLQ